MAQTVWKLSISTPLSTWSSEMYFLQETVLSADKKISGQAYTIF